MGDYVSLYEKRPLDKASEVMPALQGEYREAMVAVMSQTFDEHCLTEEDVRTWKEMLLRADPVAGEELPDKARAIHHLAFWLALTLVYRPDAMPSHIEMLRQHYSRVGFKRHTWLPGGNANEMARWFANVRFDAAPGSGALHISPLAKRDDSEYPACMELLTAVQSQLAVSAPAAAANRQESRRPPIVLSVLNNKGRTVATGVIDDVATDLMADVVHLDAHTLARLVGGYLGQNQYSARGSISMLGYAAAEINGRLAPRPDPEPEQEIGMVAVSLPSRLRSFLSTRDSSGSGLFDGRWEDMKIGAALDALVAAADLKRRTTGTKADALLHRPLIIHVHDYVELSALQPTMIRKLQAVADRMCMAGRRTILLGSSSGDVGKVSQWRDQLNDLGRDGAHIIPFHAEDQVDGLFEHLDNAHENLRNIHDVLQAMVGDHAQIKIEDGYRSGEARVIADEADRKLLWDTISSHLYDAQWVQRLASLMVGSQAPQREEYGLRELLHALKFLNETNNHWASLYPAVRPPYFSPLLVPPRMPSPSSSTEPPSGSNLSGAAAAKEYNSDEKRLLSGLINAKDIHTTFNDIIVPQETKESLIGLTSLSLIRPEAFSYGVLKTERIPGCLLYGPPGTGKTLLAKAVAKESGASMLEVSAASINDKWLGQSEKNVQALFSLARKLSPCVIFLDEADALLAARRSSHARAAHRETITQFLREWDGLSDMRAFIMVATNRPFDLDEAVLRRLPRKILVDLPLAPEREAILRVMLKDETLAEDVDLAALAQETDLYSGSDLKNLCVSAAMEAVREEVRAKEAWTGEGEYQWPERRVLNRRHFDKGLREISASISGDMESLKAIRKFDEQFGDAGRKRKARRGIGFEVVPGPKEGTEEARVRQVGV
jgi:SpoVK/Ycf46/Vps4 family AAA+-type ATPase